MTGLIVPEGDVGLSLHLVPNLLHVLNPLESVVDILLLQLALQALHLSP